MATLRDIFAGLDNFETSKGAHRHLQDYPDIMVFDLVVKPVVASNLLRFEAAAESQSKPSRYNVAILFGNQVFSDKKTPVFPNQVPYQKRTIFCPKPTENDTVQLRCSCRDFQFRFSNPLADKGALIGSPLEYKRVPGSTRPPVNPRHTMGLCKHLWAFLKALKDSNYISL